MSKPEPAIVPSSATSQTATKPLKELFLEKIQNLVELRVSTVVTAGQTIPTEGVTASGPYILTSIDLLEGDIHSEINEGLLDPKFQAIREAHAVREQQALAIIHAHFDLIAKAVDKIAALAQSPSPSK